MGKKDQRGRWNGNRNLAAESPIFEKAAERGQQKMFNIGYKLCSEEHAPGDLVNYAKSEGRRKTDGLP